MVKLADGTLRDPSRASLFESIVKLVSRKRVEPKEVLVSQADQALTTPVTTYVADNSPLWTPRSLRTH